MIELTMKLDIEYIKIALFLAFILCLTLMLLGARKEYLERKEIQALNVRDKSPLVSRKRWRK